MKYTLLLPPSGDEGTFISGKHTMSWKKASTIFSCHEQNWFSASSGANLRADNIQPLMQMSDLLTVQFWLCSLAPVLLRDVVYQSLLHGSVTHLKTLNQLNYSAVGLSPTFLLSDSQ